MRDDFNCLRGPDYNFENVPSVYRALMWFLRAFANIVNFNKRVNGCMHTFVQKHLLHADTRCSLIIVNV